jgi:hypothetical protein
MPEYKENNRVLNRLGARELSVAEYEQVGGGFAITNACTFNPKTCKMDFDCEPPIRCPI